MGFDRLRALVLLSECTGDEIWSLEHCRSRGIPQVWVDDLQDCFESGFARDSDTIYVGGCRTNQYLGVRDVDLALKLGEYLGVDVSQFLEFATNRAMLVRQIQEAVEEE